MRAGLRIAGGREAITPVVRQPYYLKPMPGNPYLGAEYDLSSCGSSYQQNFKFKPIHFLQRFRYNLWPVGQQTGYYGRNKWAKHVHWLEVSTIERVRVQLFGEEAIPMCWLSIAVIAFTIYHCSRLAWEQPDSTMYFATGPFTRPWVQMTRFSEVHPMHKPVPYKYFQRCPEWFSYDAYKELIKLEVIANDPFIEQLKLEGRLQDAVRPPTGLWFVGPTSKPPVPKPMDGYQSYLDQGPRTGDTLWWGWRDMFWDKTNHGGWKRPI